MFNQVFLGSAAEFPNKIALSCNGLTLTYQELNNEVSKMAQRLNTRFDINTLKGKRIALVMPKCIEHYVALLLIWRLGASIVFVRAPFFDEKLQAWQFGEFPKILTGEEIDKNGQKINWKVDAVIAHSRYDSVFSQNNKLNAITFYADEYYEAKPARILPVSVDEHSEAYIGFTSGTTGKPKGAINTHEGINSRNESHRKSLALDDISIVAQDRPLYIDASLQEIMMTWAVGARLEVIPEGLNDWQAYVDFYNASKITHAIVVPAILKQIHAQYKLSKESPFTTLKYILTTGESMSVEIYDYFAQFGITLVNGYGPSEATIGAMLWTYEQEKGVSIGKPMDGVEAYIVEMNDESVKLVDNKVTRKENGEEGQLLLSGVGIGLGYTNNLDLTKERFRYFNPTTNELLDEAKPGAKRCYLTGDKVSLKDGLYYINGRYDRQLKINGKLLSPEEIEETIKLIPAVEEVQVDVLKADTEDGPSYLIAGVKFKQNQSVSFENIQEHVRKILGAEKVPTLWKVFASTLPKIGSSWKNAPLFTKPIDRTGFEQAGTITNTNLPTNQDEETLAKVTQMFQSVLPRSQAELYPQVEFQYLGGTSILVMLLARRLREAFKMNFIPEKLLSKSINDVVTMVEAQYQEIKVMHLNEEQCEHKADPKKNLPIFFIHALLGDANNDYDRFAEYFDNRAIYGISAITANQQGDLDEYAKRYKKAIQKKFYDLLKKDEGGPYILVGWSSGGVIAHRICELLRAEGHDVGLFLLDSTSSNGLMHMNPQKHTVYAATLAKLTGRFLAGMMQKYDAKIYERFKAKVERIKISEALSKEQQIDAAFRQLENINEDFRKPEVNGMMEDYYRNAKTIRDAWSIALAVLNYKDFDAKNEAQKPKDGMHRGKIGERYCRLFYAEERKDIEFGTEIGSDLGWTIDKNQIIKLPGTHLSMMKKTDDKKYTDGTVPPEFELLVKSLQDDFEYLENKWGNKMDSGNVANNSSYVTRTVTDAWQNSVGSATVSISDESRVKNIHMAGGTMNIGTPSNQQGASSSSSQTSNAKLEVRISGSGTNVKNVYVTPGTMNITNTSEKKFKSNHN